MDRWVRCAKSFQTNLIWPSPVPYNGRYSVRPERKEEQEAADLHLFWVRPESEKVDQKLRGAAFRVLREEKTTEIGLNTAVAVRSYSCNRTTSYSSDTYRTGLLRSHSCTLHDHEHVYTAPSEPASTCTNMDPLSMLLLPRRRPACAGCLSVQLSCLSRGGERMQDRWAGCMPLPRCAHACLPDRQ